MLDVLIPLVTLLNNLLFLIPLKTLTCPLALLSTTNILVAAFITAQLLLLNLPESFNSQVNDLRLYLVDLAFPNIVMGLLGFRILFQAMILRNCMSLRCAKFFAFGYISVMINRFSNCRSLGLLLWVGLFRLVVFEIKMYKTLRQNAAKFFTLPKRRLRSIFHIFQSKGIENTMMFLCGLLVFIMKEKYTTSDLQLNDALLVMRRIVKWLVLMPCFDPVFSTIAVMHSERPLRLIKPRFHKYFVAHSIDKV